MTRPRSRSSGYRPELDGIRAVAVLLVIVFHVVQPRRFSGFIGVDIFFALSGYLITTILLREIDGTGQLALGRFYARRMLRLYPALLAMIVLSFPFYRTLSGSFLHHVKNALVAGSYTSNLYMTYRHRWIGGFAHTWSLALEEQYYLVWPILLLGLLRLGIGRRRIAVVLGVAALGSAAASVADFRYGAASYPLSSTTVGLLAGSALGAWFASGVRAAVPPRRLGRFAGGAAIALLIAVLVTFSLTRWLPAGLYVPAAVLATVLLIMHLTWHRTGRLAAVLAWGPAAGLGRISYGVYLYHYPLLLLLVAHLHLSAWWLALIEIPATIALAALSFRYLETPFLRLKDRLHAPRTLPERPLPLPTGEHVSPAGRWASDDAAS